MIEFENVSKSFWTGRTRKIILNQATFRVELGNSLGILASNGAGKTTIINMMAGLEQPDEGTIKRSSRISFPLGFMGGVVNRHSATENSRYFAFAVDRAELPDYRPQHIASPPASRGTASPGAKSSSSKTGRTSISVSRPSPRGLGKRRAHSMASSRERTWISV